MTESTWLAEAKKNSGLLIFLGVLTVIFGVLAIAAPLVTGIAVSMFVGFLMVFMGIARIVHAVKSKQWGTGIWGTIIGLLAVGAGLMILFRPGVGLAWLTLLLAIYFLVDGICEIIAAFKIKPDQGWGWMLFNGIIALLLGIMIWRQWPVSGTWAIGVLVGIHILITGWTMIILGTGARRITGKVEDVVEDVMDYAGDTVEKAGDMAESAVDKAKDLAGNAVDATENVIEGAVDMTKDAAKDVAGAAAVAAGAVGHLADEAVEEVKDLAGDAARATGAAVDKAEDLAGDAVEEVKDLAGDAARATGAAVHKAEDLAGDAVEEVKDLAGDAARATGAAVDKAEDLADDVVEDVKDAFDGDKK